MVHMMAQNQRPVFPGIQDLTPEQKAFLQRLGVGGMGGQGGDVSSFLDGGPAGDLFTGGPGHPTPELPGIPAIPPGEEETIPDPLLIDTLPDPGEEDTIPEPGEEDTLPDPGEKPPNWPPSWPWPPPVDWEPPGTPTPQDPPIIYDPQPTIPQIPTPFPYPVPTPTPIPPPTPTPYPVPSPGPTGPGGATAIATGGTGGTGIGTGGTGVGVGGQIDFAPIFNFGNPAQRAVDVTMTAFDQYQQALLDKYYADTIRDLGMAALGGGAGGGRDVVGPVGLFNRVTQGGGRYQQPEPFVKKRKKYPDWPLPPKNPSPPHPPVPWPGGGQNPTLMAGVADRIEPAADVEPDGFDAGQFVSEVQADVAGGVPAGVQADVAGESFRPPTPPRDEEVDWDKKDTEKFVKEIQGYGPVTTGRPVKKMTFGNQRALDSLRQRPPEVEDAQVIWNQGPQMRHMGGDRPPFPVPPQRPPFPPQKPPWGQPQQKAAAPSALGNLMGDIMGGAGAPLGGQLAAQIEKTGQADQFAGIEQAARHGADIAQATYGLKGQERDLAQSQQAFRQQKAQDAISNLLSRGRRQPRGGTRVRVRT